MAAPVFNRQGFVGASMRDLISATGLEKGGIYNHFGSKEQLALEAYDFAMSRVTDALARSQDDATDAVDRLTRMIRAFATFARKPAIDGGCPIMNTAIEADDGNPELRDRAQRVDDAWHRLIGRIVKDGIAAGTLARRYRSLRARVVAHRVARRRADALAPLRRSRPHRSRRRAPRSHTSRHCAPSPEEAA